MRVFCLSSDAFTWSHLVGQLALLEVRSRWAKKMSDGHIAIQVDESSAAAFAMEHHRQG